VAWLARVTPEDVESGRVEAERFCAWELETEGVVPAATYPGMQTKDLMVTTMDSVIMVHESLPDDVAYKVTRTLIRNKGPRLVTIHASMGAWDPTTSWQYQGLPLHPGAAKAFRESAGMPA
jgi:TRAP-type uncharacterized transport system substrate-binding protein